MVSIKERSRLETVMFLGSQFSFLFRYLEMLAVLTRE